MRLLFYSHDSYGLGHIRRTLRIAETITGELRGSSALVVTGSPRAHYFRYPPHCDYLKLPSITKSSDGSYVPRDLDLSLDEVVALRGRLILDAVRSFVPDVFFSDHTPNGLGGEILDALEAVRSTPQRGATVLGMRDIIDEPDAVRRVWARDDVVGVLRRSYDHILIYGQRDLFDPVREYALPPDVAEKVRFTGYLEPPVSRIAPREVREEFAPRTGRLVALTVGGGGDGNVLVRSFLEGYEALGPRPPFEAAVVTGPLMSPRKRRRFLAWAERLEGVRAMEYCDDVPGLYHAADLVVAMGGYNTIAELAHAGARALVVPRTFPRREQWIRARRLEERGVVRVLSAEEATPRALIQEALRGLDLPRPPRRWGLDFSGLSRLCRVVEEIPGAAERARGPRGARALP